MGKLKEVGNKKHNIRRAIAWVGVGILLLAGGIIGATVFGGSTILTVLEVCAMLLGGGLLVEGGVGAYKAIESVRVNHNKKVAKKALEKIKVLDNDKTSKVSVQKRAKIVSKYAKANLFLAKTLGSSSYGIFHSHTGFSSEQATELLNRKEQYLLLEDAAAASGKQGKYTKKIQLTQRALDKTGEDLIENPKKWSRSYDDVLDGVSVIDRRSEIVCLTDRAKNAYMDMVNAQNASTSKNAVSVVAYFGSDSGLRTTYIKNEDASTKATLEKFMLADIVEFCNENPDRTLDLFPVTLESRVIDKDSTELIQSECGTKTYKTLEEVKASMTAKTDRTK